MRNPRAAGSLAAKGAVVCATAAEVARQCSVTLLRLPCGAYVHKPFFGQSGIAQYRAAGTIIMDQTSGSPGAKLLYAGTP